MNDLAMIRAMNMPELSNDDAAEQAREKQAAKMLRIKQAAKAYNLAMNS